jgi:mannose-6-phosphate isomerase-like protein (cupin superfamily)
VLWGGFNVKLFNLGEFLKRSAPKSSETVGERLIDENDKASKVMALFAIIPPTVESRASKLHYHTERDSFILFLSGEGIETVEGKEYPVKANDLIFIPSKEKHKIVNTGNTELKYIEIYTLPSDFIVVE